jgi:hypothetical protein
MIAIALHSDGDYWALAVIEEGDRKSADLADQIVPSGWHWRKDRAFHGRTEVVPECG